MLSKPSMRYLNADFEEQVRAVEGGAHDVWVDEPERLDYVLDDHVRGGGRQRQHGRSRRQAPQHTKLAVGTAAIVRTKKKWVMRV